MNEQQFNEWFESNYGDLYKDTALNGAFMEVALKAWNESARIQNELDVQTCYDARIDTYGQQYVSQSDCAYAVGNLYKS